MLPEYICISIHSHVSILITVIKLSNIYKGMLYVPGMVLSVLQLINSFNSEALQRVLGTTVTLISHVRKLRLERLSNFSKK